MSDEKERDNDRGLEWKDYLAIGIAALQTTLLPFVVLIFVLLALWFLLTR